MADDDEGAPPEGAAGGNFLTRKWHGVPVWGWTLGGTIAGVVIIRWWRNRSSASTTSSTTASTATGTSTGAQCYDITGATVPCASGSAGSSSDGGGLGGALTGIYTGSTSTGTGTSTSNPTSTATTPTGNPTSTPTTPTAPVATGRLTAPTALHLTIAGKTGVRVVWTPVPGATGYVAQCKQGGDNGTVVNGPFDTAATQPWANFGSLKAGTAYTALIWPSSSQIKGGPGSDQPHAEFAFTTTKA